MNRRLDPPHQVVISGELDGFAEAENRLKRTLLENKKVRFVMLNVSAPFHSRFMESIHDEFRQALAATAATFADAAVNGALPTGIVVAGDERLDTLALLHQITRLGVRLQDFTGEAN